MLTTAVSPAIEIFRHSLQPIAPFTWFGLPISTLDVVAAFRLCIVMRQIREIALSAHIASKKPGRIEERSYVKSLAATLLVVYSGEAITAPMLGLPPSFMISGAVPGLYAVVQALIDLIPTILVPLPSADSEIPLSIVDGISRAYLLCNLIPPAVIANASPVISSSPWTLLITSLITANAGFFFVNLFSFMHPTKLAVQTPPELQPYGWSTADLWCAPATTALYALLTHAQPFWADLHSLIAEGLGGQTQGKAIEAYDPETARAICAILLSGLFLGRTVRNFGLWEKWVAKAGSKKGKTKTQ